MMNYLQDGACSLSNNLSENSIHPLVVGQKNWLFSDTRDGASASMRVYSMVETAKANELNPQKYLMPLLEKCPTKNLHFLHHGAKNQRNFVNEAVNSHIYFGALRLDRRLCAQKYSIYTVLLISDNVSKSIMVLS